MRQIVFRIPIPIPGLLPDGIPIYGYGLMLFVSFLVCMWVAGRRAQKVGIAKEVIQDLAIWLFVGGLLGARITFMVSYPPPGGWTLGSFLKQLPQLWDGGVILYGAVIGGLAGYLLAYQFVVRKHQLSGWKVADIAAPVIALGIGLGRVGCLLNGCCYGHVACPHCPGIAFPLPVQARFELVRHGYQSAAGFVMATSDDDPRTVVNVKPLSPAGQAGLRPGDILLLANDHAIRRWADLVDLLEKMPHGKGKLALTVEREGQAVELPPYEPASLADFEAIDNRVVRAVQPGSAAARAGLETWDRIVMADDRPVNDYGQFFTYLGSPHDWPRGKNDLKLTVEREGRTVELPPFVPRTLKLYPTQVFESVSMLLLFLLLLAYELFRRNDGELIALLMACYAVHRLLNELLRSDKRPGALEVSVSVALIVAGVALFVWRRTRPVPPAKPAKA